MNCGLIGRKLKHSYSKEIHEMLGLYSYDLIELEPEALSAFVEKTDFSPDGFAGFNITIPYKQDIMNLCPLRDPDAEKIGASNTVYIKEGKLCCTNTDYYGFIYMCRQTGISPQGKKALVLGNGGASLMVQKALADMSASSVVVAVRDLSKVDQNRILNSAHFRGIGNSGSEAAVTPNSNLNLESSLNSSKTDDATIKIYSTADNSNSEIKFLANESSNAGEYNIDTNNRNNAATKNAKANNLFSTTENQDTACPSIVSHVYYCDYSSLPTDAEIIVNTTPVGMYPKSFDKLIDLSDFPRCCGVLDLIYNPLRTPLVMSALEKNIPASGGLSMLVAQATKAAGYFSGRDMTERTEEILRIMERRIANIILIGMPGSGKTTIGQKLAATMGRTFVDIDDEIVKTAGMSIPEIFAGKGEEYFRDLESRVIKEHAAEKGLVIAPGGGAVLRKENVRALKANGTLVFVERPLESLARQGRPLSKDADALKVMYEKRLPLYKGAADISIKNQGSPEDAVSHLLTLIQ